jgi:hypothetical protein
MNIVRVLIVRIDREKRERYFAYFALADFFVRLTAFIRIVFSFANPYRVWSSKRGAHRGENLRKRQ